MSDSRYYLQIISLIYIVLITIVFYTKKIKKTTGSRIFSQLIFSVLLCAIFDFSCVLSETLNNKLLNHYLNIAFLLSIVKYVLVFTEYITLVVSEEKEEEKRILIYEKIHFASSILYIVWSIFLIYIANYYYTRNQEIGSLITNLYCGLSWIFCLAYWIVIMSRFLIRHIDDEINFFKIVEIIWMSFLRNLLPIAVAIIPGTIALLIQFFIPGLHVIVPLFTFAVINMYFTIFPTENPDLNIAQEMEIAKMEADKANESKTEFLSNVSHEIRTPLNAILGFSKALLEQDINDNVREEVEYIVSSSEELLETVNEILDISKIESNRLEIVNVDYSPEKIYKNIVGTTIKKIGNKPMRFIHNFDYNIPKVLLGDYVRINQIITNVLNNAIKYTESGFIKLKIECDNITNDKCRLVISVADSGIGIEKEDIEKIFYKFKGMEVQKDVHIQGNGLGLSLTKKLVEMMGGKIIVKSNKGEGSTFIIYIEQNISNKNPNELENLNEVVNKKEFIGNGQKILIVDDNAVNLKVALRLMKDYNLQIDTLTSGKECISKIQSGTIYDLVMLDDMMPEMSGVETLSNLKNIINYNMTTIALTANAVSGMKEKYINEGFDDYLSKPIDKKLLDELLIKYLGNNNSKRYETNKNYIDKVEDTKIIEENKKILSSKKNDKDFLINNNIDLDKAMEFLGDMEMYDDTVKDFLIEVDEKIINLEKFKNEQDMPNYAIVVHSLKSDAKYLGIMDLADIAYKHEMASKSNDIDFVNNDYQQLMSLLKEKISILKRYME